MASLGPLRVQTMKSGVPHFAPHSPSPLSGSTSPLSGSTPNSSSESLSSMLSSGANTPTQRPEPKRNASFPTSRPLRPFASIAQTTFRAPAPSDNRKVGTGQGVSAAAKPKSGSVKLIEPPKTMPKFTLNLTQAEFSRRDY